MSSTRSEASSHLCVSNTKSSLLSLSEISLFSVCDQLRSTKLEEAILCIRKGAVARTQSLFSPLDPPFDRYDLPSPTAATNLETVKTTTMSARCGPAAVLDPPAFAPPLLRLVWCLPSLFGFRRAMPMAHAQDVDKVLYGRLCSLFARSFSLAFVCAGAGAGIMSLCDSQVTCKYHLSLRNF